MKRVPLWPTEPQPERMLDRLGAEPTGTLVAVPLADGRLFGVAVRLDGYVRLFPPSGNPIDLPPDAAALVGVVLSNRLKGGEE